MKKALEKLLNPAEQISVERVSVSAAALRSDYSWVKRGVPETIIQRAENAESICDPRWFPRPLAGVHTVYPWEDTAKHT